MRFELRDKVCPNSYWSECLRTNMPVLYFAMQSKVWCDVLGEAHLGDPCVLQGTLWCTDEARALVVAYHAKARQLGCSLSTFAYQRPLQKGELAKDDRFQVFKITTNEEWASHVARQHGWNNKSGLFSLSEFRVFDVGSWAGNGIAEVETQEAITL